MDRRSGLPGRIAGVTCPQRAPKQALGLEASRPTAPPRHYSRKKLTAGRQLAITAEERPQTIGFGSGACTASDELVDYTVKRTVGIEKRSGNAIALVQGRQRRVRVATACLQYPSPRGDKVRPLLLRESGQRERVPAQKLVEPKPRFQPAPDDPLPRDEHG
jgi:hypothetical protein